VRASLACSAVILFGCAEMSRTWYLRACDRDIDRAAQNIAAARGNPERAAAFTERGKAYSEKARYSRAFKLISSDEYSRLFGLAVKDHDQAVALDQQSAEAHYHRGHAFYDRAVLEESPESKKEWFARAVNDFQAATQKDTQHYLAFDRLGLIHEVSGDLDQAISDYTKEMALNSMGRLRLADAYCARGLARLRAARLDAAITDYEKSIEIGSNTDGCSCDPFNPVVGLYADKKEYDKAWVVVRKALASGKVIDAELLIRLRKQ